MVQGSAVRARQMDVFATCAVTIVQHPTQDDRSGRPRAQRQGRAVARSARPPPPDPIPSRPRGIEALLVQSVRLSSYFASLVIISF